MPLHRGSHAAVLLCAAVLAAVAAPESARGQRIQFVPASRSNYGLAGRPFSAIRLVVVHVTEGTYAGTIRWFRNPRAHASANYVVSREGAITEMVANSDVAWHAGNSWVNEHSIGVEHEGYTAERALFTDAQYRASARLVAGLLRRYVLPIDRRHVIGHSQVPDPLHPWLFGGFAHHTDPGRYWDWSRYMTYVRSYARGVVPPPPVFDVAIPAFHLDQALAGIVRWPAKVSGQAAARVDFLVDGRLRDSETQAPYALNGGKWDTRFDTNGEHVLTVHAVSAAGRTADASVVVSVKNPAPPPPRITSIGFVEGQPVTGRELWEVRVSGLIRRIEFLVDGTVRDTESQSPYVFGGTGGFWDTTEEAPGPHTLAVRAIGAHTAASARVHVVVLTSAP